MNKAEASFEKAQYYNFVNPNICRMLRLAGLTEKSVYQWHVTNNIANLVTYFFDKDDYYSAAAVEIYKVTNPVIIPAYSLKDMEMVMPGGYSLLKDDFDNYELSLDMLWNVPAVKGKRLPDVFAEMLLQLIRSRIINPETANNRIVELLK